MKYDIRIGKPCHYRPTDKDVSACGIVSPEYAAYDIRDVDCIRCKKTKVYKEYMKPRPSHKYIAKITYMWGDWYSYRVSNIHGCKDSTDKSAFTELFDTDEKCIQMGKVCVERLNA